MDRRHILLRPFLTWAALLLLGSLSLAYALVPAMPAKPFVELGIVAMQAAIILFAFMNLGKAGGLVRMTALIGVVWLSFLFLMSFADLATR